MLILLIICTNLIVIWIFFSNEFGDLAIQKSFIQELIQPINWILTFDLTIDEFINFIGLNVKADNIEKPFGQNRSTLLYAVNLLLGLLKRIKRMDPLLPDVIQLLQALFPLITNLNLLWKAENQVKCYEDYRNLIFAQMTEAEKNNILEIQTISSNANNVKTINQRIQNYIWSLHDNCYSVLGIATSCFSNEMYVQTTFMKLFEGIECLPDWKLRMILRNFLKPLIANCPNLTNHYEQILLPILYNIVPFLFKRINVRWDIIKQRSQSLEEELNVQSDMVEQELLEDQLNRMLSREFVELLTVILLQSKSARDTDHIESEGMFDTTMSETNSDVKFSELGNFVLQRLPDLFITTAAVSLTWLDSYTCLKSSQLNLVLVKKIINERMITNLEAANFLLQQVLNSLTYFGEHEQNQASLLQLTLTLYEGVIKNGFVDVKQRLSEITGSSKQQWDNFDEKWIFQNAKIPEKKRKEALRKLLGNIIGRNIGQYHKYTQSEIKNLRPVFSNRQKLKCKENVRIEIFELCSLFDN